MSASYPFNSRNSHVRSHSTCISLLSCGRKASIRYSQFVWQRISLGYQSWKGERSCWCCCCYCSCCSSSLISVSIDIAMVNNSTEHVQPILWTEMWAWIHLSLHTRVVLCSHTNLASSRNCDQNLLLKSMRGQKGTQKGGPKRRFKKEVQWTSFLALRGHTNKNCLITIITILFLF